MKTTVIHHSSDFDGLFCREIARKFLPDAELIGWDFGDKPLNRLHFPMNHDFIILDLPVDRVFGEDFSKEPEPLGSDWKNFIWIDHHASSIASHPADIPGYRIDGVAACRLAWQWFTYPHGPNGKEVHHPNLLPTKEMFVDRNVDEPMAVRLAGEYDIWDKRDPRAELFQHGLRSEEITLPLWQDWLLTRDDFSQVDRLLKQGQCLQYARAQEYEEVINKQGFDIVFEGLQFLACCSHELDIRSHLFAAGIQPHHDGLFGFTFNGKSFDWRVSLYHAPGKEHHDLSKIAVKYGGGGHKGACGMRLKNLPFLP